MPVILFTVGRAVHPVREIGLPKQHGVGAARGLRSQPRGRYNPQHNLHGEAIGHVKAT